MDGGENSQISNNEVTLPLSPVLGSGQSKKLLKNRIRKRKVLRKCERGLSYNAESQNDSKRDCNVSATEPNPHCKIADRIKRLEALENKRLQMINTISVSSLIPNELQLNQITENTLAITDQMLPLERCSSYAKIQDKVVSIPEFRQFQTGSGNQISVSKPQLENSKKLFDDIFHAGVARDKKYNYLCSNSTQTSASNSKISVKDPPAHFDSLERKTYSKSVGSSGQHIFDDLAPDNDVFQAASLQLEALISSEMRECLMPVLEKHIENSTKKTRQVTKKIFEGENFDDLSPSCHQGFQAASVLLNTSCDSMPTLERQNNKEKTPPRTKNIIEAEDLFCVPTITSKQKALKQIKNIFEGETFDDLKPDTEGFQAASVRFNTKSKEELFSCAQKRAEQLRNNQDDLKPACNNGFQAASLHVKANCDQRASILNKKESFDDLKPACSRFQTPALHFKSPFRLSEAGSGNLAKPKILPNSNTQLSTTKSAHHYLKHAENTVQSNSEIISNNNSFDKPESLGTKQSKVSGKHRNIFEDENFDDLKAGCSNGVQAASFHLKANCDQQLSPPKVLAEDTLRRRKNIFEGETFDDLKIGSTEGFQAASLHLKQPFDHSEAGSGNATYSNKPKSSGNSNTQLNTIEFPRSKRGGNTVQSNNSENLGTKPSTSSVNHRNIFEDENFDDLNLGGIAFQTAADKVNSLQNPNNAHQGVDKPIKKPFRNIFEGESFEDLNLSDASFTTKICKPPTRTSKYAGDFRSPLKTISECEETNDLKGFPLLEQQQTLKISDGFRQMLGTIHEHFQSKKSDADKSLLSLQNIGKLAETIISNKEKLNWRAKTFMSRKRKISEVDSDYYISYLNGSSKRQRKRLGCFVSPSIQVQPSGMKTANHLFEELDPKTFSTSTPVKLENLPKPLNCNLTPVPNARKKLDMFSPTTHNTGLNLSQTIRKSLNPTITTVQSSFSLSKPAEADVRVWLGSLDREKLRLQEQLRIVNEKQAILREQATTLDLPRKEKIKPKPGVLYESKRKANRVSLREYVRYSEPGAHSADNGFLHQIDPHNSHLMHFISCQRISHVLTDDGAVIIPNVDCKIGISEIEHSFKLLEGVDTTLIPANWIRNHYKWIIWKLASYERMFPKAFDGCLSLENVMQQLKYRYDVEIDKAQRSALRKIFEKDDCPQKRMVLCVSRVVKVNDSYELELTDGWYPIRTVIDLPLCDQIIKRKIKIGTKMIVCGAELMHCEGCHPLEATDLIHLKVSFNCSRRALWWCKLGYQKQANPFVIPMSSINMNGGKIGCLRCFIVRVYPVKFLETCGSKKVWRNQKADERCEQNFYTEQLRRVDSLHNKSTDNGAKSISYNDVKNIEDPQILYDYWQRSKDPENFQEMLSSAQHSILYNYSLNKSSSMQTTDYKDDKTTQRTVKALLKIKIVDACYNSDTIYDFQVWEPTESHLHELREGEIVTIFNTSCSPVWGLNASKNTQFKVEGRSSARNFEKFKRKVTHIKDMETFFDCTSVLLHEFDTVGIVVKKTVNEADQQVWIADREQRLLLIKICDSPKNILVLDMINEGQIVSVCNLVFQHRLSTHSFALGNHFVIFARYSKHKHLQEALDDLEKDFSDIDRHDFILNCTRKIKNIGLGKDGRNPMDLDGMECSQITTTDIALLECLERLAKSAN